MLTKPALIDMIGQGQLRVCYHFDTGVNPPVELPEEARYVDPGDEGCPATQAFERKFFGDRLALSLGPLVLSHTHQRHRSRARHRNFPGVFDLRKTENRMVMTPGESLTVNTVEKFTFDGSIAAASLPRLTQATAGVVATPSYVDPHWDGLLVFHLTNFSPKPIELRFGERIAICRFYRVDGAPVPADIKKHFKAKRHHFGLSWDGLLNSDEDPFPARKRPVDQSRLDQFRIWARTTRPTMTKAAALLTAAIAVGAILVAIGRLDNRVEQVDRLEKKVDELQTAQDASGPTVNELRSRIRDLEAGLRGGSVQAETP